VSEVRCGSCDALNRVPLYSVTRLPKCGMCHAALPESRGTKGLRFFYRNRAWAPIAVVLAFIAGYTAFHFLTSDHKPLVASTQLPPSVMNSIALETPVSACLVRVVNGQVIGENRGNIRQGHILTIDNGSTGNAIIKVRDTVTGHVVVSFFVEERATASFRYLNDGNYRIQYVLGGELAENCKTFNRPLAAKEFPGEQTLVTSRTTTRNAIEIDRQELTFTLYSVPSGNIMPRSIDLKDFDAE
jgi:hypothetical protein